VVTEDIHTFLPYLIRIKSSMKDDNIAVICFYRAMHYSAKRGIAIA